MEIMSEILEKWRAQAWKPDELLARPQFSGVRYAPATEEQLLETEKQLSFSLPAFLRQLYKEVGNGGFGPGFGIIGASGGYVPSALGGDIVAAYHLRANGYKDINYKENRKSVQGQDVFVLPRDSWSQQLLPLCDWGCLVTSFIDAQTGEIILGGLNQYDEYELRPQFQSLQELLEHWLQGDELI